MAKGGRTKNKSKRSVLPRGIPQKRTQSTKHNNSTTKSTKISPFEYARSTNSSSRVKHHVHNKQVSGATTTATTTTKHTSALAKSIERRKQILTTKLSQKHKSNTFIDRRIGEANASGNGHQQSLEDDYDGMKKRRENAMLKRIVAERVRRSKRVDKFSLEEDEDEGGGFGLLTHRVSLFYCV